MTTLALVRHGQTDWNLEGRYQGQTDLPLNAAGLEQARALAASLDGRAFDAIYSSDLQRAEVTARIIAERLKLPLHTDPRLREINQGEWEGMLVAEIKTRYAQVWTTRLDDPENSRSPGGESIGEVSQRMWEAADDIARQWPDGKILVVSHGMALATLLVKARGLSFTEVFKLIPENTRIIEIEWRAA
jgi:alpha-ribazole phosphatase